MQGREFEQRNAERWREYEQSLNGMDSATGRSEDRVSVDPAKIPVMFREVCADLALARHRMYGMSVNERLNTLVIRGHKLLHRRASGTWGTFFQFVTVDFPVAVRVEWRLLLVASLCFVLPILGVVLIGFYWPNFTWIEAILGDKTMDSLDMMYGSSDRQIENLRSEYGSNFMMFSHYVYNNIGIDFRIYAGGILACLGSFFFLIYNGVFFGAVVVYIHVACSKEAFYSFVASHSSYELIAMVVAGMAGLRIGLGLLHPGRKTLAKSLMDAGRRSLPLIIGAALMTFFAAIVEGFWSARDLPVTVKYVVGIAGWILCVLYFVFGGRVVLAKKVRKIEGGAA